MDVFTFKEIWPVPQQVVLNLSFFFAVNISQKNSAAILQFFVKQLTAPHSY